jgi:hypothetical protein
VTPRYDRPNLSKDYLAGSDDWKPLRLSINYVGHAEKWDDIEISGSLEAKDCAVTYEQSGKTLAVATIGRDLQSLQAEAQMSISWRGIDTSTSRRAAGYRRSDITEYPPPRRRPE